jgi:hypothetical protein
VEVHGWDGDAEVGRDRDERNVGELVFAGDEDGVDLAFEAGDEIGAEVL